MLGLHDGHVGGCAGDLHLPSKGETLSILALAALLQFLELVSSG